MVDQNTFMETIKSVAEIMRVAETPLSQEEILSYFADMELDETQKQTVLEYLLNPPEESGAELKNVVSEQPENEKQDGEIEGHTGGYAEEVSGEHTGGSAEEGIERYEEDTKERKGESAVFRMYLEEVENLHKYSDEEELELYRALLQGDQSAVAKLSDCWLPRVLKSAEGYVTPKLRMEDLVQEGNMALILALQQLCGKEKCDDVEGTLVAAVEEGIMNYASEMNGVKESEEAMLARVNLVHEARKLLTEEQGSVPSVEELSEYTKMPVQELKDIIDVLDNRNN